MRRRNAQRTILVELTERKPKRRRITTAVIETKAPRGKVAK